jgi:hypothetical protein
MDFLYPFRPSDAAQNHSALDFAYLAVRTVEKDEAGNADFHWRGQDEPVCPAAIRSDDAGNFLSHSRGGPCQPLLLATAERERAADCTPAVERHAA